MNAVEMNDLAIKLASAFEDQSHRVPQAEVVKAVMVSYDPALSIAVRTKIKSETERKRFDALMLLEGVQ